MFEAPELDQKLERPSIWEESFRRGASLANATRTCNKPQIRCGEARRTKSFVKHRLFETKTLRQKQLPPPT